MIAKNRIWEEIKQAKTNIICLQRYTDRRRRILRYYNIFIITVSAFGALSFKLNETIPVVTSILVALVSLVKSSMPNFIQSEQEISELDRLTDFYSKYLNTIENLWYKFYTESENEKDIMISFFEYKSNECDKYSLLNKGIRSISKKEQSFIDKELLEYINRIYYITENKDETHKE